MMGRSHLPVVLFLCGLFSQAACAEERSLHQQIDDLIVSAETGPVAEPADDATFLRRASLDLIGRIPTRDEVEAFLGDDAPDKRRRLIDELLGHSNYPHHMAAVFELMLMERRGGTHVKSAEFRTYLEDAFAENRSYLDVVRELLSADGTDEKNRAAAAFYLEREVEPHLLTRDVGRIFYGIDLQCAQCHDHPLIDDYHQPDYYGLHAFFVRSNLFHVDKKKPALIAEQATGEADFKSVFTDREGIMGPRVPGGEELVAVTLKPTEQYQVAPTKNVRPIPALSRREQLAEAIAEEPTPAFKRNIVNRIWAHLFGRGLVHPVDLHHSANPPMHPEVLELLAASFAESNYDVKWLLRELALTGVYQRSFRLPPLESSIADAKQRIESARLVAETNWKQSYTADEKLEALLDTLDAAQETARPFREAESAANNKVAEALKPRDAAQAKVATREKEIASRQNEAELLTQSVEKTRAAADALKNDKELAAALSTIEKRATAHSDGLAKLQETYQSERKALAAAEEALKTASAVADEAIAARVPHEETVRSIRADIFAAREIAQGLRMEASLADRDVKFLETLLDYDQCRQQILTLQNVITQHDQSLTASSTAIAKARQQEQLRRKANDQATTALAVQQQLFDAAEMKSTGVEQTQSQLADAIASAEAAGKSLPEAEPVSEAVALLRDSLAGVDAKLSEATAAVEREQSNLLSKQESLALAMQALTTATESLKGFQEQAATLEKTLAEDRQRLEGARASLSATWDQLVKQSSARGNAASLTPLTPEQLGWSILIATGQYDRQRSGEAAKLNKEKPLSDEAAADPKTVAAREQEIDATTRETLKGTIAKFVKLYGAGAGQPQQEFFATAEQSLFVANGSEVRSWLQPAGENLSQRLLDCEDNEQLARELYLSVMCRPPSSEEVQDVKGYLASRADKRKDAIQELAWGLLSAAEFRFRY